MVDYWLNISQKCILCSAPTPQRHSLCEACQESLPKAQHRCHCCDLPLPTQTGCELQLLCGECLKSPPAFDKAICASDYEWPINRLINAFKFQQQLDLGPLLAGQIGKAVMRQSAGVELLLPLPLHAQRLQERGFNQTAELTRVLSQMTGIPWRTDQLQRIRRGEIQHQSKRTLRMRGQRNVFHCKAPLPERVAIIDDVITTGSTAHQAAKQARLAGANYIEIWAIARTAKPDQR